MTASDQLYKLADRAKQAEQNIGEAKAKNEAALREDVERAREASRKRGGGAQVEIYNAEAQASSSVAKVQGDWNEHVAQMRDDIDETKAEHEVSRAQRRAKRAEGDAEAAVNFAYAALVEAEYAVLDAQLAGMEAEETAATR